VRSPSDPPRITLRFQIIDDNSMTLNIPDDDPKTPSGPCILIDNRKCIQLLITKFGTDFRRASKLIEFVANAVVIPLVLDNDSD